MLVTALNPVIGYDKSCEIAKCALFNNLSLREAATKLGYLSSKEFDLIVNPKRMIG